MLSSTSARALSPGARVAAAIGRSSSRATAEALADGLEGPVLGLLAVIGGSPQRFAPYVELYKQAGAEFGTSTDEIGLHSPGFIADSDEEAVQIAWPAHKTNFDRIGKSRGWPPMQREHFDQEVANGSLYIGSPETVAQKMARTIKTLGINRFDLVYGGGPMPASARLKMIELYGKKVIPRVKEILVDND